MSVVAGTASTPGRHRERLAGILARGPARPVRRACSRIVGSRHAIAGVDSERRWLGDGAAFSRQHPALGPMLATGMPSVALISAGQRRMPGLFVAGELPAAGGRAVLEVMLYEGHLRARSRTRHPGHPDVGA